MPFDDDDDGFNPYIPPPVPSQARPSQFSALDPPPPMKRSTVRKRRREEHGRFGHADRVSAGLEALSMGPAVPGQRLQQSLMGGRGLPQNLRAPSVAERRMAILERLREQRTRR